MRASKASFLKNICEKKLNFGVPPPHPHNNLMWVTLYMLWPWVQEVWRLNFKIWMPLKLVLHHFAFKSRQNHNYLVHMSMSSYFELYLLVEGCIQSDQVSFSRRDCSHLVVFSPRKVFFEEFGWVYCLIVFSSRKIPFALARFFLGNLVKINT